LAHDISESTASVRRGTFFGHRIAISTYRGIPWLLFRFLGLFNNFSFSVPSPFMVSTLFVCNFPCFLSFFLYTVMCGCNCRVSVASWPYLWPPNSKIDDERLGDKFLGLYRHDHNEQVIILVIHAVFMTHEKE
jgi:polyferredoxin